jgi:engulfment/cell motility protein 1
MAHSNGHPPRARQAPNGAGSAPPAAPASSSSIVPTNVVTTRDGQSVKTRIDPSLSVADVVKQLCINLQLPRPPTDYGLRDDTDELVTDDNLRRKIKAKAKLKCVPALHSLPARAPVCVCVLMCPNLSAPGSSMHPPSRRARSPSA